MCCKIQGFDEGEVLRILEAARTAMNDQATLDMLEENMDCELTDLRDRLNVAMDAEQKFIGEPTYVVAIHGGIAFVHEFLEEDAATNFAVDKLAKQYDMTEEERQQHRQNFADESYSRYGKTEIHIA